MANYQNKPNKGVLFRNSKRKTDKHPEYAGSINVNGQEFFLNAWVNESKKGDKYFSMSVVPMQAQGNQNQDVPI